MDYATRITDQRMGRALVSICFVVLHTTKRHTARHVGVEPMRANWGNIAPPLEAATAWADSLSFTLGATSSKFDVHPAVRERQSLRTSGRHDRTERV